LLLLKTPTTPPCTAAPSRVLKFGFATAIPAILGVSSLYSVSQETIVPIRVNAKRALFIFMFSF
jgi:hypothetical protein